jgi:hypothetical protein
MRNSVRQWLTFAREIFMKRRIEIIAIEHERTVQQLSLSPRNLLDNCPVCQDKTQWLTTVQVARAFQVKIATVQRWLATRKVHGIRTPGGQHRICQHSLVIYPSPNEHPLPITKCNSTEESCLLIRNVRS